MVANMKRAFTDVNFRHNWADVIQKGLTFKRMIIIFRLAYMSEILPNESAITQLLFAKYCTYDLLKTQVLNNHYKEDYS